VGFAVFDRVLLTVHPADGAVRDFFAQRLAAGRRRPRRAARHGGPASPADLMLRMVNHMVDSYLDLRRLLTRQLGTLQPSCSTRSSRFHDWQVLLDARNTLHGWKTLRGPAQRGAGVDRHPGRVARHGRRRRSSASASCCACARATCWSTSSAC
jgi:hypothetical protein